MIEEFPYIVAAVPTYRRPKLVENTLALWDAQTYPADRRKMIILEDGGTFQPQTGPNWEIVTATDRGPSLGDKFNRIFAMCPPETFGVLIWEDDDIYLPGYVAAQAAALKLHGISNPMMNWVHYGANIGIEHRWFHSALAVRKDVIDRIGGYPVEPVGNFDMLFRDAAAAVSGGFGQPWDNELDCQYVMGYSGTGYIHASTIYTNDLKDLGWYDRYKNAAGPVQWPAATPKLDPRTRDVLVRLKLKGVRHL
jgi:hypothetical protein